MKAVWNDQVIAEAAQGDLIYIEGNWYFPPSSLKKEHTSKSSKHTICHWKGKASYLNLEAGGQTNQDALWYYPMLKPSAIKQVKKDFTNYVAFWHGVSVSET